MTIITLPTPFRRSGQQIAEDGNDKVFCDLWCREQIEIAILNALSLHGIDILESNIKFTLPVANITNARNKYD